MIIVAGSGRSGTTWLGNIIAGDEYRILFEPFDFRHVPEATGLGLRPYFRPNQDYPQWRPFIEKVLSGRIGNEWVDQDRKRLDPSKYSDKILVKEIRANGMLAWMDKNFHCKIVYIIRHPCAVIASRMKLKWDTHFDAFLSQSELLSDYLAPYEGLMRSVTTDAQKHALMWCAENIIPLDQMASHDWIRCTYEDLFTNTEREVARILDSLGLELTQSRKKAIAEEVKPAWDLHEKDSRSPLSGWQSFLSDDQKNDVFSILRAFGLKLYKVDNVMPVENL